jgi:hypothetical protein
MLRREETGEGRSAPLNQRNPNESGAWFACGDALKSCRKCGVVNTLATNSQESATALLRCIISLLRVVRAPSLDVEFRMERKSEPRRVLPTSRVFGFALSDAFAFDE